jgi:hypothetical protein
VRGAFVVLFIVFGVVTLPARSLYPPTGSSSACGLQGTGPGTVPKSARSGVQQKLSSKLLYEIARVKDLAERMPAHRQETGVKIDDRRRALVDVRAAVTSDLRHQIHMVGGTIVSSVPQYESTIAWVPLLKLERLATNASVKSIEPAAEAALQ